MYRSGVECYEGMSTLLITSQQRFFSGSREPDSIQKLVKMKLLRPNISSRTLRRRLLSFCFGILVGFSGRAVIYADLWWFFLLLLALCFGMVLRNQRLKDEIDELNWRLEKAERFISRNVVLVEQSIKSEPRIRDSHTDVSVEQKPSNLPLFTGSKDANTMPNKRRKIRITKLSGIGMRESHTSIVGYEEHPPEKGKEYRFFSEQGTVFETSSVMQVSPRYLQTENATYEIEVINES